MVRRSQKPQECRSILLRLVQECQEGIKAHYPSGWEEVGFEWAAGFLVEASSRQRK